MGAWSCDEGASLNASKEGFGGPGDRDGAVMSGDCSEVITVAAYLLGALEPAQAQAFARHLAGCPVCRAEADALAPVIRLLRVMRCDRADLASPLTGEDPEG